MWVSSKVLLRTYNHGGVDICNHKKTYLLAVELTLVLDLERLLMMESPQLTTPPLFVMLNVLSR